MQNFDFSWQMLVQMNKYELYSAMKTSLELQIRKGNRDNLGIIWG